MWWEREKLKVMEWIVIKEREEENEMLNSNPFGCKIRRIFPLFRFNDESFTSEWVNDFSLANGCCVGDVFACWIER